MGIQDALVEMLVNADREGANGLIEEWGAEHGFENLLLDLLTPALRTVGDLWRKEEDVSLAHAYVASKIAEDALRIVEEEGEKVPKSVPTMGPVVVGNIEDDCHPLGRKLVVSFLKAGGWRVCDLGNDVPAAVFVDEATRVDAKVIGVSAMTFTTAENIRELRTEINRRGLEGRIQLAVGGAVFRLRPELVEEVGGDGTAPNAIDAPALFDRLWNRAVTEGTGNDDQ